MEAAIQPEMERNCLRWPSLRYTSWQNNVKDFRAKLEKRVQVILPDILEELQVTPQEAKKYGFPSL